MVSTLVLLEIHQRFEDPPEAEGGGMPGDGPAVESGQQHRRVGQVGIDQASLRESFDHGRAETREQLGGYYERPRPIDTRYCEANPWERPEDLPPFQNVWLRANGTLPDDPLLHICVLTYASDMTLLDTSLQPHGSRFTVGEVFMASLDHAMWFHRPFRSDEWLLYAQDTPSASGGRGLGRGLVYSRDGRLVERGHVGLDVTELEGIAPHELSALQQMSVTQTDTVMASFSHLMQKVSEGDLMKAR